MKKIVSFLINIFFSFFKLQDKIVFESGRGLVDGNPKAVYDYMLNIKQNKYKLIWIVEKGTDVSVLNKGDYVYYHTFKNYYHLATARYWIRSQSMGSLIKKRKGQVYIQLWHGNGAMKYMEYDITNDVERPPLEHTKEWDYFIANDEIDAKQIRTSTGYDKKIDILGMATSDTTLMIANDNNKKKEIIINLGLTDKVKNKKIIFYAPTFRDYSLFDEKIDVPIRKLSKLKNCLILVRLHPLDRNKIDKTLFKNSNMIDVCEYPNASDILAISDVLITDYSSIFYEYSPLNRPIVFYFYDYQKYLECRRGFYLNIPEDLPGKVCYNEEELFDTINNIDIISKEYQDKQKTFNKRFNYYADGKASKRFVDKLLNNEFK